ncbi:FUSC family protein [Subtercola lobariae]|uniref:Integral membrane bound transporter domain-containing protein n=1 Tax=Subtercola lobariae TaxID=1588641 RepID=A0A917AZ54_9MICO|nr:FUSC family protein [Subtercola lobariae]GGF10351.1 hypothetical protein GCM10011399_00240 [Subtercola lobariae]
MGTRGIWHSGVRALKPKPAAWAVFPAIRAVIAAGAVAAVGAATGHMDAVGVAYFGAACAVVFITNGGYRTRLTMLAAQAFGAVAGIVLGIVLPHDPVVLIVTATVVGMLAGMLGVIGPAATATAVMAVIGLAFGQFAGLPLPWWQQGAWYLAGTFVVAIAGVSPWILQRWRLNQHVAATASKPSTTRSSFSERSRASFRVVTTPDAIRTGIRLALCMAIATATVVALREPDHSYWLPLTVAVVVRPEYGSVFVRTVNRVVGTIIGATVAALVLLVLPASWPIAVAAALAIGFAVFAAPKLYALSVIGITASALLSASIGTPDPVFPLIRLLDTLLGCTIAVVFGYLLWPGSSIHLTSRQSNVPVEPVEPS